MSESANNIKARYAKAMASAAKQYSLVFIGTHKPPLAIDPASFPIVVRIRHSSWGEGEDADEAWMWMATNESGSGHVSDSHSKVYTEENLETLVQSLARAGFKNVRLDLTDVPVPPEKEWPDFDCPF